MPDGTLTYQELYNIVKSSPNNKDMSFSDFQKKMNDPSKSQALYSALQGTEYKSRLPQNYDGFLDNYGLSKKKSSATSAALSGGIQPAFSSASQNIAKNRQAIEQGKPLPADTTTNLNPHSDKVTTPTSQSPENTVYKQATDDARLDQKVKDWQDQYYNANALGQTPAATPSQMLSPEEMSRLDYKGAINNTRTGFMSNPYYLDPKNREAYYESLPKILDGDAINNIKETGEYAASQQMKYNYYRALPNPSVDDISGMGTIQAESGDLVTATKTFQHLVETYPNSPQGYQGAAYVSALSGNYKGAIDMLNKSLITNPGNTGSLNLLGQYQYLTGNHADGYNTVSDAIESGAYGSKEVTDAYRLRAAMRLQNGDQAGASSDMAKAGQSYDLYQKNKNPRFDPVLGVIRPELSNIPDTKGMKPEDARAAKAETESKYSEASQERDRQQQEQMDIQAKQDRDIALHMPSQGLTGLLTKGIYYAEKFVDNTASGVEQSINTINNGLDGMAFRYTPQGQTIEQLAKAADESVPWFVAKNSLKNTFDVLKGTGGLIGSAMSLTNPYWAAFNVYSATADNPIDLNLISKGAAYIYDKLGVKEGDLSKSAFELADMVGQIALFSGVEKSGIVGRAGNYVRDAAGNLAASAFKDYASSLGNVGTAEFNPETHAILQNISSLNDKDLLTAQQASIISEKVINGKGMDVMELKNLNNILQNAVNNPADAELVRQHLENIQAAAKANVPVEQTGEPVKPEVATQPEQEITPIAVSFGKAPIDKKFTLETALKTPPKDAYDAVMSYLATPNNSISSESYINRTGMGGLKGKPEFNKARGIHSNEGLPHDQLIEKALSDNNIEATDANIEAANTALEDILKSNARKSDLQEAFTQRMKEGKDQEGPPSKDTSYGVRYPKGKAVFVENIDGKWKPVTDVPTKNMLQKELDKKVATNSPKTPKPVQINVRVLEKNENGPLPYTINPNTVMSARERIAAGSIITQDGAKIDRLPKLAGEEVVEGGEGEAWFTNKEKEKFTWALVDPKRVVEQHVDGMPNDHNFLQGGQPMNRVIRHIYGEPENANLLNPATVAGGNTAYDGAPIINEHGEVFQRNGTMTALREYIKNNPDDPNGYYEHLKSLSDITGLSPKDIEANKGKVLVRKFAIGDDRALELSDKTALHMKEPTLDEIMSQVIKGTTPDQLQSFLGDYSSLQDFLSKTGGDTIKHLIDEGYLNQSIGNMFLERDGSLSAVGIEQMTKILRSSLADGAHDTFLDNYEHLPTYMQRGLDNSIFKILKLGDNAPLTEIQNATDFLADYYKTGASDIRQHMNQVDEHGDKPINNYNAHTQAMIDFMQNAPSADTLPKFLDGFELLINGNENEGVPPMTKDLALDKIFGTEQGKNPYIQANQYLNQYGFEKRTETNAGTEGQNQQPESRGEANGQTPGQAPNAPKRVKTPKEIVDANIPVPASIEKGVGITQNSMLLLSTGWLGRVNKALVDDTALSRAAQKAKGIRVNGSRVIRERIGNTVKEFYKHYPDMQDLSKREVVYDWLQKKARGKTDLPILDEGQQKLAELYDEINKKGVQIAAKGFELKALNKKEYNLVKDTVGTYMHDEPLIHSRLAEEYYKQQRDMLAMKEREAGIKVPSDLRTGLDSILSEMAKKRADAEKRGFRDTSDIFHHKTIWKAIDTVTGKESIIHFSDNDKNGVKFIDKYENKKASAFGAYNAHVSDPTMNGSMKDILESKTIVDANGRVYKLADATVDEKEQHTGMQYIKDPVYLAMIKLERINDMYQNSLLYHSLAHSPELNKVSFKVDPKQLDEVERMQKDYHQGILSPSAAAFMLRDLKLPADLFSSYSQPTELPDQFHNIFIRKNAYNALKYSLFEAKPMDSSAAMSSFIGLAAYAPMYGGLGHFQNIAEMGLENFANTITTKNLDGGLALSLAAEALHTKNELYWQVMGNGGNLLFNRNEGYTDMIRGLAEHQIETHPNPEFKKALEDANAKVRMGASIKAGLLDDYKTGFHDIKRGVDKFERATVWWAQDMLTFTNVIREMARDGVDFTKPLDYNDPKTNLALQNGMGRMSRYTVDYRMPDQIIADPYGLGKGISKFLQSKAFTIFGNYSYGKLKVLYNDTVDALKLGANSTANEKLQAYSAYGRWASRALMLHALSQWQDHLNKDKDEKEYTNVQRHGSLTPLYSLYQFSKGEISGSQFFASLLHASPVIGNYMTLLTGRDMYNHQILNNDEGHTIDNVGALTSAMFSGGGNIFKLMAHVSQGDAPKVKDDLYKLLSLTSESHYSPEEYRMVSILKNYKDFYEPKMSMAEREVKQADTPALQKKALSEWMSAMYNASNDLIQGDVEFTTKKIEELKKGVYTPTDAQIGKKGDVIVYWEKHLAEVQKLAEKRRAEWNDYMNATMESAKHEKFWMNQLDKTIYRKYHPKQ